MLEPFWGEFLISPIPLELSLNYCSHKCGYCFANLNNPKRSGDVKKVMRFLSDYVNRSTIEATLLKEGYPVCVSNRSDPFSYSNYKQMIPIMRAMTELEIPLQIQTKGGPGANEVLEWLPPSVWYISISMLDDDIRRKIEPGAPSIDSRLELIEKATDKGHRVVLGLNPAVPEWLPGDDLENLLVLAQEYGAEGVWVEELHLNYKQVGNMSEREKSAIGPDLIERAKKKIRDQKDAEIFFRARDLASELDYHVFSNGQPTYSEIWQIYRDIYPKTFPTNQDFINYCTNNNLNDHLITYELWESVVLDGLPWGKWRMSKYIGSSAMSLWETHNIPSQLSYKDLLGIIWQTQRAKQSPVRMPNFAYAGFRAQNGWIKLIDGKDFPYLVFDEKGEFTEYFAPVNVKWGDV